MVQPDCFYAKSDGGWTVENGRTENISPFIQTLGLEGKNGPFLWVQGGLLYMRVLGPVSGERNDRRSERPSCFYCSLKLFQLKILNIPKCHILGYPVLNLTNMILVTLFCTFVFQRAEISFLYLLSFPCAMSNSSCVVSSSIDFLFTYSNTLGNLTVSPYSWRHIFYPVAPISNIYPLHFSSAAFLGFPITSSWKFPSPSSCPGFLLLGPLDFLLLGLLSHSRGACPLVSRFL